MYAIQVLLLSVSCAVYTHAQLQIMDQYSDQQVQAFPQQIGWQNSINFHYSDKLRVTSNAIINTNGAYSIYSKTDGNTWTRISNVYHIANAPIPLAITLNGDNLFKTKIIVIGAATNGSNYISSSEWNVGSSCIKMVIFIGCVICLLASCCYCCCCKRSRSVVVRGGGQLRSDGEGIARTKDSVISVSTV